MPAVLVERAQERGGNREQDTQAGGDPDSGGALHQAREPTRGRREAVAARRQAGGDLQDDAAQNHVRAIVDLDQPRGTLRAAQLEAAIGQAHQRKQRLGRQVLGQR